MFQTTNQLYLWWNVPCFFHDFPMFFPWFSQTTNQINIMELGTTPNLKAPPVRSSMSRTSRSGIHRSAWDRARGIGKTGPSVCVTWLAVSGLRQNKMRDICMYINIYDIYIWYDMIWYDMIWYIYIYIYDIYKYICIYIYDDIYICMIHILMMTMMTMTATSLLQHVFSLSIELVTPSPGRSWLVVEPYLPWVGNIIYH